MHRILSILLVYPAFATFLFAAEAVKFDYIVLATSKTSTMEKELNAAADAGYVFSGVMGGDSAYGGKEVIVVMSKNLEAPPTEKRRYKLLATSKTSTLQKEMQLAGGEGFDYCGQTVFESAFGGKEVSVILEQASKGKRLEYLLLATSKTSTMQKELKQAGETGFEFLGVVVGQTALGGKEVVSILKRPVL